MPVMVEKMLQTGSDRGICFYEIREFVDDEDVRVLLQEPPYLGLLPAPTLSQILQSQKNSVFAILTNRSKKENAFLGAVDTVWHQRSRNASDSSYL